MQTKHTHREGFFVSNKKKKKKKDKRKICYAFPTWPKFPEIKGFRLLWTLHFSYSFAVQCFHMMPMRVWYHNMVISGTSCSSSREEEHKYLVWNWHNGNPLGLPFLVMWNFFLFMLFAANIKAHTAHFLKHTNTSIQLHAGKSAAQRQKVPSNGTFSLSTCSQGQKSLL